MEEELEQFCNNCKRNIRAANFHSHHTFCCNHIVICKICDEPVPRKSYKEHEDEYHVSVLCDLCYISLQKWMLPKHQEQCPKRRMICEFCDGEIPFDEFEEHANFCGSRTEKCLLCSKYIMLKDKKVHSENHLSMETRGAGESGVDQNVMNELTTHSSTKKPKSNDKTSSQKLDYKDSLYGTDDFSSAIGVTSSSPNQLKQESSDYYTICHWCAQYILWTDYRNHIKICSTEFKTCPHCDQAIQCFVYKKHITINCPVIKESSVVPALIDKVSESQKEPEKNDEPELKGVGRLLQNLKHLMHDEKSSDVLLKVEDREFRVHKVILKVRSPVFTSMFQPNTKESATGVVDIPDCSADAFEIFLSYIYTGSADSISLDNVVDVYYAADKYQINDLKSDCVEFMKNNLSVDNFCEVMTLTLQHSEMGLQKTATRFFCNNVKTIIKTVEWQKYLKDNPTQANELYIKAINA